METHKHRPLLHFSPLENWMNDPNGMVYYKGEYHLFYQHHPQDTLWGPMHWGHAVSKNLISWEHLPIAIYPDDLGYIFSGSAIVDWENSSGLQKGEQQVIIAMFTYHNSHLEKIKKTDFQYQGIVYSNDNGRNWEKYPQNPVLRSPDSSDFRDPKLFWHEKTKKWICILAVKNKVQIFNSSNLIKWEYLSSFGALSGSHGGIWECPDLFPLKIEENGKEKWVLLISIDKGAINGGSGTQYFIGSFDGKKFVNAYSKDTILWLDYGRDNYAGVTWSDIPKQDGRRIFIGWMSNWEYATKIPTLSWRNAMTLPRELKLRETQRGIRLLSTPVKEFETLRKKKYSIKNLKIEEWETQREVKFPITISEWKFSINLSHSRAKSMTINFFNTKSQKITLVYQFENHIFSINRKKAGKNDFSDKFVKKEHIAPFYPQKETNLLFHIILDVSSIEVFIQKGELVMTERFFPDENFTFGDITAEGELCLNYLDIYELKSIFLPSATSHIQI